MDLSARCPVPDADRAVVARRGKRLSVRAKRQRRGSVPVAGESAKLLTGVRIPDLQSRIRTGRSQVPPVRTEFQCRHAVRMTRKNPEDVPCVETPDLHK